MLKIKEKPSAVNNVNNLTGNWKAIDNSQTLIFSFVVP